MTLVEKVYEGLREEIVFGGYPPEDRLRAEHIKNDFGVSGGTVREALTRLISDGLVTVTDRRGFRVAPFTPDDLADITAARLIIEPEAVRQSIENGDDRWEIGLVGAYHHLSKHEAGPDVDDESYLREFEKANRAFHDCLVAACPSLTIKRFYRQLFARHYRYRRVIIRDAKILRTAKKEHKALLKAAIARDTKTAAKIIKRHISRPLKKANKRLVDFSEI